MRKVKNKALQTITAGASAAEAHSDEKKPRHKNKRREAKTK